ncbi:type II secretion system secretin GspD [Aestuariivirga sp.]|uniref:type II secretion system secretin GspD n=1 Tax=Aestuariivirga sp. TaxID=2650926 RepID=UPI0025B9BAE1|nr:type II secretion system secretin GspD [Aestuariivirga sp.]MCA3555449.1 type II secretion system secretin GspD [Aestuariivirga sp.]
MRASGLRGATLLGCAGLLLASCQAPTAGLESTNQIDLTARSPQKVTNRGGGPVMKPAAQAARYEVFPGVSPAPGEDGSEPPAGVGEQNDGKFTVNLDGASVAEASKLILGETLGYNYTIDPNLQGSITMVSNRPLSARQLLDAFEASLKMANAALVQSDGSFRVVLLQAMESDASNLDMGRNVSAGYGVSAVPLRHVAPSAMVNLLDGFMQQLGSARAWNVGNMILIRGPASQRRSLVEVVTNFDIDTMKNQTFGMAALENGRAEDISAQVMKVFAQDSANAGPNSLKIIPVPSLNSLIIIANDQAKVRRAITWVKRLDRENLDAPKSYVYAVQNGNATELAKILSATYGAGGGGGTTAEVAPDSQQMDVSIDSGGQDQQGQNQQPGDMGGMPPQPPMQPGQPESDPTATSSTAQTAAPGSASTGGATGFSGSGIRITPIAANNTLLIRASPKDYREILSTLAQIDQPSTQVLISTTIAEVQLNDTLRYGVQAYFESGNFSFILTDQTSTTGPVISPKLPGMNFVVGGISSPQLVVDALSKVTNVRVVSSPSLLVMENETATIKVGDQVPIQTQTETTQGGQTVNSFEYRDTGVVLKVKPRVSANGAVMIDLGQELSAVQQETGIGGQPKFTQRTINSKVSVNDQQTVLLGGLINGTEDRSRVTVPGANQLPLLGRLIGTTGGIATRNEMLVFITPTIVRNGQEASRMSQDLRAKMKNLNFD